jgi:hypothetical protein
MEIDKRKKKEQKRNESSNDATRGKINHNARFREEGPFGVMKQQNLSQSTSNSCPNTHILLT